MINDLVHAMHMGINWLLKNIWWLVIAIFLAALSMGWIGFYELINTGNFEKEPFANVFKDLYYPNAFILAFLNLIVGHSDNLSNEKIIGAQALSYLALTITVIITLLKKIVTGLKLKAMNKVSHSLIIGLGQNNRTYLLSEYAAKNNDNIIIIETDPNNIYIDHFRELGFGVFIGTLDEYKINFSQLKNVVISTGVDQINIELAGKLIAKIPETMSKEEFEESITVYIHIQNQDYKILFHQKILDTREGLPLEFKPYSFYDDAVRLLFEKHTLLGNYHALAKTDDPYSIIVVGNGDLAERIIYHMCMLANLPNQNKLTVHCICEDAPKFLSHIKSNFPGIDKIESSIELTDHSLCMNTPEFFKSSLWVDETNLTNVFICHDDQNINFECAVNLHDKVYLQKAVKNEMKTKVHFAMYHGSELRKSINENKEEYKEFYTFGNAKSICDRDHLIDETHEGIAKQIHRGYAEVYDPEFIIDFNNPKEVNKIKNKWLDNTKFSDRESNRSQALHINTKLMSLGLQKVKVFEFDVLDKDKVKGLLDLNIQALKCFIDEFEEEISIDKLIEFSCELGKPYSKPRGKLNEELITKWFNKLIQGKSNFSRLMNAEHERWNAFHYLNGWTYNKDEKIKETKEHNCLIPLHKFNKVDLQMTIVYDLYSILYLPNYLASTGYRIVPLHNVSIGITGHRNIDLSDEKLQECLKEELEKIMGDEHIELISPLAEGSDRLFVDMAIEVNESKINQLTVPMPFEKNDYITDFSYPSTVEFEKYLSLNHPHNFRFKGLKKVGKIEKDNSLTCMINVYSLAVSKERLQKKKSRSFYDFFSSTLNIYLNKRKLSLDKQSAIRSGEKDYLKKKQQVFDEKQYEKVGHEVVQKSDVLFVIYNGKQNNGQGGTAEIFKYAQDYYKKTAKFGRTKKIVWINPEDKNVEVLEYPEQKVKE